MSRSSGDFISGFVFGAFFGAVLALLFAPAPGEDLRDQIKEKSIELKDRAEELSHEATERAEELRARGEHAIETQKQRFQEAIEEGRRAAEQKKEELLSQFEGDIAEGECYSHEGHVELPQPPREEV
jgi:gas vesicle protein